MPTISMSKQLCVYFGTTRGGGGRRPRQQTKGTVEELETKTSDRRRNDENESLEEDNEKEKIDNEFF